VTFPFRPRTDNDVALDIAKDVVDMVAVFVEDM